MPLYLKIIVMAAIVAAVAGGAYWYLSQFVQPGTACTLEAKLCPDGSSVGRTGPNCEFAACPGATSTASSTATSTGGGTGGIAPYDSGISGVVMLGPTCPVERIPPDPNCADKPYQTLVAIFRANDATHAVMITTSDASGTFAVSLPPGDYTVGAGESNLPRCDHPQVTVLPHTYATTTVSCDTGIR